MLVSRLKIPKSFQLLGHTYVVQHVDDFGPVNGGTVGLCEFGPQVISIKKSNEGQKLSRTSIEQTFCHELVHAIYQIMGENEMCANECHVDMFAGLLHQALTSGTL